MDLIELENSTGLSKAESTKIMRGILLTYGVIAVLIGLLTPDDINRNYYAQAFANFFAMMFPSIDAIGKLEKVHSIQFIASTLIFISIPAGFVINLEFFFKNRKLVRKKYGELPIETKIVFITSGAFLNYLVIYWLYFDINFGLNSLGFVTGMLSSGLFMGIVGGCLYFCSAFIFTGYVIAAIMMIVTISHHMGGKLHE